MQCERNGCQLWGGLLKACGDARKLAPHAREIQLGGPGRLPLKALALAFALPLALFMLAVLPAQQASDAWALAAFLLATACGWFSLRWVRRAAQRSTLEN